jgi:predicted dehydrogenase
MNKRVKIGILGFSNIAKKSMLPAILSLPDSFELVGVASLKNKLYSNIKFYNSYDKLLKKDFLDIKLLFSL